MRIAGTTGPVTNRKGTPKYQFGNHQTCGQLRSMNEVISTTVGTKEVSGKFIEGTVYYTPNFFNFKKPCDIIRLYEPDTAKNIG